MSAAETRSGLRLPSDEKFSRMTATTRLRKTKDPRIWKATKKATACTPPQLLGEAFGSQPRSGVIMQSSIMPAQPSPVRHWKRRRKALLKVTKLLVSVTLFCHLTYVKSCTPSTENMNMSSASSEQTLTSEGSESTMVMIRSRTPFAPLSSRRMRSTRKTRSTRSSMGGSGSTCARSSAANWSSSEVVTRKKSNWHQASEKYCLGPRPLNLKTNSM